jgi:predicted ATPase
MDRFEGGVWIVDLSEAASAEAIAGAVSRAARLEADAGEDAVEAVAAALGARPPQLLLLDSFERAGEAGARALARWVERAPLARFLATGRVVTGVAGEREFRLLPFPAPGEPPRASDAVRLFFERAREAKPDYEPTAENEGDVAALCRELEGIPLAIELAAARIRIMQPGQMLRKLGQKFQLLRSARQDAAPRQQTLAGAIEWSFDLLTPEERRVFLRLSVFRGGFLGEAAARVAGEEATPERLEALRGKSLLSAQDWPWGRRYLLSGLVREVAEQRWAAETPAEERLRVERAHATAAVEYAAQWADRANLSGSAEALDRLACARENLGAVSARALGWAASAKDEEESARWLATALSAVLVLDHPMAQRGTIHDWLALTEPILKALDALPAARRRLRPGAEADFHVAIAHAERELGRAARARDAVRRALEAAGPGTPARTRANALRIRALFAGVGAGFDAAAEDLAQAEALAREDGDTGLLADVLNTKGLVARRRGAVEEALACFEEAWRLTLANGSLVARLSLATNLATILKMLGRNDEALARLAVADDAARAAGRPRAFASGLLLRATLLLQAGDPQRALAAAEESERLERDVGRPVAAAVCRGVRAQILAKLGRTDEALESFDRAEEGCRSLGDAALVGACLGDRGDALYDARRFDEALAAYAAAVESFRPSGNTIGLVSASARRARCLAAMGRLAEARAAIERADADAAHFPAPIRGRVRAERAIVAGREGRREEARRLAREAAELLGPAKPAAMNEEEREVRQALEGLMGD